MTDEKWIEMNLKNEKVHKESNIGIFIASILVLLFILVIGAKKAYAVDVSLPNYSTANSTAGFNGLTDCSNFLPFVQVRIGATETFVSFNGMITELTSIYLVQNGLPDGWYKFTIAYVNNVGTAGFYTVSYPITQTTLSVPSFVKVSTGVQMNSEMVRTTIVAVNLTKIEKYY